jgi:CO dehydrogenase nickel-insertion accessory protein CooC1
LPIRIAVSGKDDLDKTTVAAFLAYLHAKEGRKVITVDADPASSLMTALGVPKEQR